MTMTDTDELTEAERFAELQAEAAGLEAATLAAQRAHDVDGWLTLLNRAESLPADLVAAELAVLQIDVEASWAAAQEGLGPEELAAAKVAECRAEVDALTKRAPSTGTVLEQAEHGALVARAREVLYGAERAWAQAQDHVGHALFSAERAEARMIELGADPDVVQADRTGVRAEPRPVATSVTLSPHAFGSLAGEIEAAVQAAGGKVGTGAMLLPGNVPPRWIAHRFAAHVFDQPPPVGAPTTADIERARQRQEQWDLIDAERKGRQSVGRAPRGLRTAPARAADQRRGAPS